MHLPFLRTRRSRLPRASRAAGLPLPRRPRQKSRSPLAAAALGLFAGVGVMLLFDPANRRRRARARDRAVHLVALNSKRTRRAARGTRRYAFALGRRLVHETPRERMGVDDRTLEQRVESTIFRAYREAKGAVAVDVHEGVVSLRGQLDDLRTIAALEREARKVPGISAVVNLLHGAGTVAPNKAEAIEASGQFLQERAVPTKEEPRA